MRSRLAFLVPAVLPAVALLAACGSDGPAPQGAIRLIAPLSTATVTSRRPTLRWQTGSDFDGAHVEICRDRACANRVTAFDAAGASGAPAAALPSGVLFWRAFGRKGSGRSPTPSATWELTVGARSAPVDTSGGSALDVNGDGYADLVIGATALGANTGANVYLGGPNGTATTPSFMLAPLEQYGGFYGSMGGAGDVNGDGYADFVVRDDTAPETDAGYVFLGGETGLPAHPSATLLGHIANFGYPGGVAGAGDVNGDGYGDIVLGDTTMSPTGTASIYLGSASGPSASPAVTVSNPAGFFGAFVAGAGDVNGDGYADVLVGDLWAAINDTPPSAFAYVYLGGPNGLATTPAVGLTAPNGSVEEATALASAGDVNGDGYADILIGGTLGPTGFAYLYLGGPSGPSSLPSLAFDHGGAAVAGAGDVNGDGYADVVIGDPGSLPGGDAPGTPDNPGTVFLHLGGPSGPAAAPSLTLTNPDTAGFLNRFGEVLGVAGDVNRDGYADLVASSTYTTEAFVFFGSGAGIPATPSLALH